MRKMNTLDVAFEFGKIWAKIIAVAGTGLAALYAVAYLVHSNQLIEHTQFSTVGDVFGLVVLPTAVLLFLLLTAVQMVWAQAKWKLQDKKKLSKFAD